MSLLLPQMIAFNTAAGTPSGDNRSLGALYPWKPLHFSPTSFFFLPLLTMFVLVSLFPLASFPLVAILSAKPISLYSLVFHRLPASRSSCLPPYPIFSRDPQPVFCFASLRSFPLLLSPFLSTPLLTLLLVSLLFHCFPPLPSLISSLPPPVVFLYLQVSLG